MIPPFEPTGNHPSGIHQATWAELESRFVWNRRRQWLLVGLYAACRELVAAGCKIVYVDGSFVTEKEHPGDYDGCWDVARVDPTQLDPVLLTFDRGRATQKAKYRGELFPAQLTEGSSGMIFLSFFQLDKVSGQPKGIVALDLRSLS